MNNNHAMPSNEIFFLQSVCGNILLNYFPAKVTTAKRRDVLILPPFSDEMNKTRRMMALQACSLANIGVGALLIDVYGTGDSDGDFADARWDIWLNDIKLAQDWLRQRGSESISCIGLRLGALLAMDFARQHQTAWGKIVLWQPVLSGENMITQFLRLRTTASRMDNKQNNESVADLRNALSAGDLIEVAGYDLAPELAACIDRLDLASIAQSVSVPIHWFELLLSPASPLPLASRKVIEQWQAAQKDITFSTLVGPSFWDGHDIIVLPELVSATTQIFTEKSKP